MAKTSRKIKTIEFCTGGVALTLMICMLMLRPPTVASGPVAGPEYEVKIGFIYNFANFVTWPEEAFKSGNGPLVLCFASDNPSSDVSFKLDSKIIKGRKVKVISYREENCLEQSHIFFFGTQDREFIQKILSLAKGRSILTIGEVEGFTRMGGIINFFEERNRLRFQINIGAANRAGLKLSSQLLVSAQIVKEEHE
ncbi:MAG: YfiR family protein [Desulfobacteraceae bacterium]|nr:MAG: YfiR family protein [Desulfobacteraceae bacterium]